MDAADYDRHLKVLGKWCAVYDGGTADEATLRTRVARLVDQVATGESASLPGTTAMHAYYTQLMTAITAGAGAMQTVALAAAGRYLIDADFRDDLVSETPTNPSSVNAVLTALAAEMGAGNDDKTLSTETTSGLCNFFDVLAGAELTWNDEADETADYKDSVYVVDTIVE